MIPKSDPQVIPLELAVAPFSSSGCGGCDSLKHPSKPIRELWITSLGGKGGLPSLKLTAKFPEKWWFWDDLVLSFLDLNAYFQVRSVHFRECVFILENKKGWNLIITHVWKEKSFEPSETSLLGFKKSAKIQGVSLPYFFLWGCFFLDMTYINLRPNPT